jgi:hypothetical protein
MGTTVNLQDELDATEAIQPKSGAGINDDGRDDRPTPPTAARDSHTVISLVEEASV